MKKEERKKTYLSKDYDQFKIDLTKYAKAYFGDKIQDLSDSSVAGMFIDIAATVGDSLSYYLDHQFKELSWQTAIETKNINILSKEAGLKIAGASPASCDVTVYIEVPAALVNGEYIPNYSYLPNILNGSQFVATNGVVFSTVDDLNFADRINGALAATITVGAIDTNSNPSTFILKRNITCISGEIKTEKFTIGQFQKFLKIQLAGSEISNILKVYDASGNVWHEVNSLSQNTVFVKGSSIYADDDTKNLMLIKSADRRFTSNYDIDKKIVTLQFGDGLPGGNTQIIEDPESLALPLKGTDIIENFSIDPSLLLETGTLGIGPENTTLYVTYRTGGGLRHNVKERTIRGIKNLLITFYDNIDAAVVSAVRSSVQVLNLVEATGGSPQLSIAEIRQLIPAARFQQERIVTKEDLIARIYTIPKQFGSVYRAGVGKENFDPLSTQLYILDKNADGKLTYCPDIIKKNLKLYLNEYRLISDMIEIYDGKIVNFKIKFVVKIESNYNKQIVIASIINEISNKFSVENFQINQPFVISDLQTLIMRNQGVLSLVDLKIENVAFSNQGRKYSEYSINFKNIQKNGILYVPDGGIFELRYSEYDILGVAI